MIPHYSGKIIGRSFRK